MRSDDDARDDEIGDEVLGHGGSGDNSPDARHRDPLQRLIGAIGAPRDRYLDSDAFDSALIDNHTFDDVDLADIPSATSWPAITSTDAGLAWDELLAWVTALQERFTHIDHHVVPHCWWRHNGHVELLVALRDHERSSFSTSAPATAPMDFFRAFRDATAMLRTFTAELPCARAHEEQTVRPRPIATEEWESFVAADVARRQEREIKSAVED